MSRYSAAVLADSPALYWDLDATNGATDLSGNSRNGTAGLGISIGGYAGSPLSDGATATDFSGAHGGVTSTYAPTGADKTLLGWASRDASADTDAIFGTGVGSSPILRLSSGSQDVVFFPASSASTTWAAAWPGNGQWVFWALVFTDSANTASLYINGALVSTQANADAWGAGDIRFGVRTGTSEPFDGKMFGVAVFTRALSAGTIKGYYELGAAPTIRTAVVRTKPPLRLHVDATSPSGKHTRWGRDEIKAENTPSGLSFSTTMPGGFEALSATLPRKPETNYSDLKRLSTLKVIGAGGQTAWEGRLESAPRVSGDQVAVTPQAVGWQAHLEDDPSAAWIPVDRDLSHWGQISRTYRIALIAASITPNDGQVSFDPVAGIPAIVLEIPGNASTTQQRCFMEYDAGSASYIGSAYYDFVRGTNTTSSYTSVLWSDSDDSWPTPTASANLCSSGSSAGTFTAGASERYLSVSLYTPAGDGGTDGLTHDVSFRYLTVWGDHGLTKRGTAPDDGLYASDVISYAVRRWCPLLRVTADSITDSGFVIPQLEFRDPTTVGQMISAANRYHLRDWAVWENRTFYYQDRGARGKVWRARVAPAQLEEAGPSIENLYNGVVVTYQDVDGSTRTVGPTGSGANTISTSVMDTDPLNPANELGINRWALLSMNGVSTPAGATEVGRRFLVESAQYNTSGRAQLVGHVEDDRGVLWPAWRVRAGDTIAFVDASMTDPRRIVKSSYDASSCTNSIDLDAPASGLDALLERLQVALVGKV